jgi:hypothetical protein
VSGAAPIPGGGDSVTTTTTITWFQFQRRNNVVTLKFHIGASQPGAGSPDWLLWETGGGVLSVAVDDKGEFRLLGWCLLADALLCAGACAWVMLVCSARRTGNGRQSHRCCVVPLWCLCCCGVHASFSVVIALGEAGDTPGIDGGFRIVSATAFASTESLDLERINNQDGV